MTNSNVRVMKSPRSPPPPPPCQNPHLSGDLGNMLEKVSKCSHLQGNISVQMSLLVPIYQGNRELQGATGYTTSPA